ncbi:bacterial transcriptional activator domain-containing protein [Butyrivibrio sp. AE3006]|uniref:bacterial transcriptional activator domain-containing protein n=1 Tax=Butyrivibrio sp. AE3006 TaxID=1280673 RepID=UPI000427E3EF|nr:BTAD domain-containing putative transcriptional regulator [Butyrivibrio sp. AE3006]
MKKISIRVTTLGGFGIECDGKSLTLGRNKGSKYIQLITRICVAGEEGVLKEDLQEDIYSDDLGVKSNLNNSLNNLVYQFKKVAEKAGIPGGKLIAISDGRYVIDQDVDISSDIIEFEQFFREARKQKSDKKKTELMKQAFDLYKGAFLPELDDLYWISRRAEEYRTMYDECVDYLAAQYKENEEYSEMAYVYHTAADIDKDCEWQVGEIEAYMFLKDYKKAYALYEEMVRYYAEELGVSPTENMQRCYQNLQDSAFSDLGISDQDDYMDHPIGGELVEEEDNKPYECLFPEMSASYHILSRNMERHGLTVFLLLLTIADYEGKEIRQEEKAERRMESLKVAINETLRHGDAFCRYSRTQYLVLLTGTGVEECMLVHRRLQDRLKELAGPRASLNYRIISYKDIADER